MIQLKTQDEDVLRKFSLRQMIRVNLPDDACAHCGKNRRGNLLSGVHPAVVIHDKISLLGLLTIVPFSSFRQQKNYDQDNVIVEPSSANGLTRCSVALVDQLQTIDTRFVREWKHGGCFLEQEAFSKIRLNIGRRFSEHGRRE